MHVVLKDLKDKQNPHLCLKSLVPLINSKQAVLRCAPCLIHGQKCEVKKAMSHWAGPPCVDWSPQGSRGGHAGSTVVDWAAWAAMRIELQEPVIVQEQRDHDDGNILKTVFT